MRILNKSRSYMTNSKQKILDDLYNRYQEEFSGNNFVSGCGDTDAKIMFIGEAPGRDEIRLKKPFVGKAGAKFETILFDLGLCRDRIYLTNAIKYALRTDASKTGRNANRPAKTKEIRSSRQYLIEEIACIGPKLIITLGGVPLKMILGRFDVQIQKFAGKVLATEVGPVFPLLHPAAMIYDPKLAEKFDEDTKILKQLIRDI